MNTEHTSLRHTLDVIVVGGGAAGLNAALVLARARRAVLVIDAGAPRNAPADGVHGLLGREGTPPAELLAQGRAEVMQYGGRVLEGSVTAVSRRGPDLAVTTADGMTRLTRRLIVASGLVDRLPDIPGVAERWGRDVLHCPYCHGWEVRDRAIGVLATGPMSLHQVHLFRQWSADLTYFTHTAETLTEEQAEELAARGIRVVHGQVVAVEVADDQLQGVRLADGQFVEREAVVVATQMEVRAGFLADLGLHPVEHPSGMGRHLPADPTGRTTVPGVWVAGNVTDLAAQVGTAAAAGAMAAAQVNFDLVTEEISEAVAARRRTADLAQRI